MKTNLLLEIKKVVCCYFELKRKEKMGFFVTLKDTENIPIKVKKVQGGK